MKNTIGVPPDKMPHDFVQLSILGKPINTAGRNCKNASVKPRDSIWKPTLEKESIEVNRV
jgi:hypothetical protein